MCPNLCHPLECKSATQGFQLNTLSPSPLLFYILLLISCFNRQKIFLEYILLWKFIVVAWYGHFNDPLEYWKKMNMNIPIREGLTQKKKKVWNFILGGAGQNWVIFTLFFIFFLLCPKSCKSAKKFFYSMGGRVPPYLKVKKFNVLMCEKK